MIEAALLQQLMQISVSSLTNAVYTYQLMHPDMRDKSDEAVGHVLLTAHRIDELLGKQIARDATTIADLAQFVAFEFDKTQSELASNISPSRSEHERQFLHWKLDFLVQISNIVKTGS